MVITESQAAIYTMPENTRGVFTSAMFTRKKRIALLVEWFMQNYWRYSSVVNAPPTNDTFIVRPMTVTEFASALTKSMQSYRIEINRQRVWTWMSERNLPRPENFRVMVAIASGWQKEFAMLMLGILNSAEPEEQDNPVKS